MADDLTQAVEVTIPNPEEGVAIVIDGAAPGPIPAAAPVIQEAAPAPVHAADDPAGGLEALKRQLAEIGRDRDRLQAAQLEAEGRAAAAERARVAAENRSAAADRTSADREMAVVTSHISQAQETIHSLQGALQAAMSEGDFAKVSEINVQIGRLGARLENLEGSKNYLEQQKAAAPAQVAHQPEPAAPPRPDMTRPWLPNEAESNLKFFSPATASWMRQNQRFYTDMTFRNKVITADASAKTSNIRPDTVEYFQHIEHALSDQAPPNAYQQPAAAAPVSRVASAPSVAAAPPSRTIPGSSAALANNTVYLTPDERRMAYDIFPEAVIGKGKNPEVEYAKRKAELIRTGEYDRLNQR